MNNEVPNFSYSFYWEMRQKCIQEFGNIFGLPIINNPYTEIISSYFEGNILDLGAGKDLFLYSLIEKKVKNGRYYSLDNDPEGKFDFNCIGDIPEELSFTLIIANQFFEHLGVQEAIEIIFKAAKYLKNEGKFIITIPNILHPNRYFGDITHKTMWHYHSFYMVYKYANLNVIKIARYSKKHPKGLIEKFITKYTSRIYRMDWCDSILMIGSRKS